MSELTLVSNDIQERVFKMRFHEDFTRCECGSAYLRKEICVLANYEKDSAEKVVGFNELPEKNEIRYTCSNCNKLIYITRE
ncbi:hypothetical protein VST04_22040 [Bacillus paranthracis]|uniref:hypothetical protein n=2 Tax=Bacillus cereus group TaxID=86661 RepID=UPI002DD44618|nr:hypothetical protein [Bacillus paranthracis]MEC4620791.1 hypothetical protein [Bacillus paranthracis]